MPIRVLVVDDSGFFRRRVKEIINSDARLEVVGEAINGKDAIEKTAALRPDVITMDIEMPVMDGISAVRQIMATSPLPILMFSSLTFDGAKATLAALEAGAVDYLPKKFEDISKDREEAKRELCSRVYAVGSRRAVRKPLASNYPQPPTPPVRPRPSLDGAASADRLTRTSRPAIPPIRPIEHIPYPASATRRVSTARKGQFKLLAIGTSTGGPVALQEVLTKLPKDFPLPILLIQHMPATFTPAFAQRLNSLCVITVKEAVDGDPLTPGVALLAPGGKQMLIDGRGPRAVVRVIDSPESYTYKPSVDLTFESIAKQYPSQTLAIVLTGMGADGREGARQLKAGGSVVWAQDEESCVVYGMPAAIVAAGLADQVLPLKEVAASILQQV